jgi:hypothetical protein
MSKDSDTGLAHFEISFIVVHVVCFAAQLDSEGCPPPSPPPRPRVSVTSLYIAYIMQRGRREGLSGHSAGDDSSRLL